MTGPSLALLLGALMATLTGVNAFQICLSSYGGFSACDVNKPSSMWEGGVDIDLIRWIAGVNGWTEIDDASDLSLYPITGRTFSFKCTEMGVTDIVTILATNGTTAECAMGAGSQTITKARMDMGTRFSYPYLRTGLGIMIYTDRTSVSYDMWAFLKPFHWSLWITIFATVMVLPPYVWVVEQLCTAGTIPLGRQSLFELHIAIFHFFLSMFNLDRFRCISWPAQLILITFLFQNLVVISTYTANLAASLTIAINTHGITSVSDLVGAQVATETPYIANLNRYYGLITKKMDFKGLETFTEAKEQMAAGLLDSYLSDRPSLEYYMISHNQDCSLGFLNDVLLPFDYGYSFHKEMDSSIIDEMNQGIMAAQASNQLDTLTNQYITFPKSNCAAESSSDSASFLQLAGLWIVIAGAAGIGLLMSIYKIWVFHHGELEGGDDMAGWKNEGGIAKVSPSFKASLSRIMSKVITKDDDSALGGGGASMRITQSFHVADELNFVRQSQAGNQSFARKSQGDNQPQSGNKPSGGKVAPEPQSGNNSGWTVAPVGDDVLQLGPTDGSRRGGKAVAEGYHQSPRAPHSGGLKSPLPVARGTFNTMVANDGTPYSSGEHSRATSMPGTPVPGGMN